jgi:hypothetical protein
MPEESPGYKILENRIKVAGVSWQEIAPMPKLVTVFEKI